MDDEFDRHRYYSDESDIPLPARFFWMECSDSQHLRWYVPGESDPVADGVLTELVQEAFDRIEVASPELAMAPSADSYQLTGLRTWLAIEPDSYRRIEGTLTVGALTIAAWLEPVEVVWELGTGDVERCSDAGTAYDAEVPLASQRPTCSYVYTHTPAHLTGDVDATSFPLTARVVHRAGYHVTGYGYDDTYDLGQVDGPAATHDIEVRELRAIRTTSR